MKRSANAVALVVLGACAEARPAVPPDPAPVWTDVTAWRLSAAPIVTIRGGERNMQNAPLDPVGVVQLSDGRYVVGDGNHSGWDALLVYDSTGRYIERWGREGKGPGEFAQLYSIVRKLHGDTVATFDSVDNAYELFAPDGSFVVQSRVWPSGYSYPQLGTVAYGFGGGITDDGTHYRLRGPYPKRRPSPGRHWTDSEVVVVNRAGRDRVIGSVRIPSWIGRDINLDWMPFGPTRISTTGRSRWYFGSGEDFRVTVFDTTGESHVLTRALKPQLVGDDKELFLTERAALVAGRDGVPIDAMPLLRLIDFPEYKAMFSQIVEDDDENVWIEHFRWPDRSVPPDAGPTTWSVFDRDGRWLGEVVVPARFMVSTITTDKVLGFFQDELDVKHVRVYPLIKPLIE